MRSNGGSYFFASPTRERAPAALPRGGAGLSKRSVGDRNGAEQNGGMRDEALPARVAAPKIPDLTV
jgi:hypothetical protein